MSFSKPLALAAALFLAGQPAASAQTTTVSTAPAPASKADSAFIKKLAKNFYLVGKYRALDVDRWIIEYGKIAIDLAAQLPEEDRRNYKDFNKKLVNAYTSLAEAYAGQMQVDSAFYYIEAGKKALANDTISLKRLNSYTKRYKMIGQQAPKITVQHWFAADSITPAVGKGETTYDPKGKITLLEFSAHWCTSCMASYDAMRRMYRNYGRYGLNFVVVTQTYGEFKGDTVANPLDEVNLDTAYFFREKKLPATLGVYVPAAVKEGERPFVPHNSDYNASGIPQVMVIDSQGIVRYIAVGWDTAAEGYLERVIEQAIRDRDKK